MIGRLLEQIVQARPEGFPEITLGASGLGPRPWIALYPGKLETVRCMRDQSGQPRISEFSQKIEPQPPMKSYPLQKTPLEGSVRCHAVYDGGLGERRVALTAATDYTIDSKGPALILSDAGLLKVSGATSLALAYSLVGSFAIQEFTQSFSAEVRDDGLLQTEQWASLLIGFLLTSRGELLAACNGSTAVYRAGDYVTRSTMHSMSLVDALPEAAADGPLLRVRFEVSGQMELRRDKVPEFGIIQRILSPGHALSDRAINLEIVVDSLA